MNNDFNVYLPIDSIKSVEKSTEGNSRTAVLVAGWASTPAIDFVGESIMSFGIDDSYFKESGWIDYEHDKSIVIGVPTENTFTDPNKGLYVEAELFRDMPEVQEIMRLDEQLRSVNSPRKLGFSIEGNVIERDERNPKIITKVKITGVAITKNPANSEATWDMIQKSQLQIKKDAMTTGTGISPDTQVNGGALRVESLAGAITSLATAIGQSKEEVDKISTETINILDSHPELDTKAKILAVQIFTGLSADDAGNLFKSESED